MFKKFIRGALAATLAMSTALPATYAAETLVRPAPASSIEAMSSARDEKIINKLLEIRQELLKVVNQGFDVNISKLDPETSSMTREYFVQERNAYADQLLAIYGQIESDRSSHGLWEGAGEYYVSSIREVLSSYKSDVRFLRDYVKNPSAYDLSDADRKAAEDRMIDMQSVFVDQWDKWVSPFMQQDYKETGKMDMTFESDIVDATLSYDSYTSLISILRGQQSADVKANLSLEFKKNKLLPTELQGTTANVTVDAGVKVFSNSGTYVTVRDMSVVFNGGLSTQEQASVRAFVESIRGKTIHIPLGASGTSTPSFDVVIKAFDQSVRSLAQVSIFTPVIRNSAGDAILAVNPAAVNQVSTILVRELDVPEEQLASESLIVVPQVVWHEDANGLGEFYRAFSMEQDGSTGHARLAYDDNSSSLVFTVRLTGEEYEGTSKLSIDMNKDRYFASLFVPAMIDATLDWNGANFKLNANSLESNEKDRTVLSVEGTVDFDSRVNLVGNLDGKKLFAASYERVDNRSTYSFDLTSEFPAYSLSSESIPFTFKTSGYYDSSFGSFPIDVPANSVEVDEWTKQFENSNASDVELLDGLIQMQ